MTQLHRRREIARIWKRLGIPEDYAASRGLPLVSDARVLVSVGRAIDDGRIVRLAPPAARAWKKMQAAALADGVELYALSGFRSVARQTKNIRRQLAAGRPIHEILRLIAAPGCSEHHSGRALDIGGATRESDVVVGFEQTREYRWLRRHAERFGFVLSYPRRNPHGISFEPWHWCWSRR